MLETLQQVRYLYLLSFCKLCQHRVTVALARIVNSNADMPSIRMGFRPRKSLVTLPLEMVGFIDYGKNLSARFFNDDGLSHFNPESWLLKTSPL